MLSTDYILEILKANSPIEIVISLLISIAISLAGVLPSVFVTGANIVFFGPVKGFLISLLGETLGAYIAFIVYRLGFKKNIIKLADNHRLLSRIVDSGEKNVGLLILQGRIIPFVPSGLITLSAALSSVSGYVFIVMTLIGKVPSIALEALVSYDLVNINENWIRLSMTVICLSLAVFTLKKRKPTISD